MPTRGSQPTLEDTRAVASLLFHHFARDRFLQAGLESPQIPLPEHATRLIEESSTSRQEFTYDAETDDNVTNNTNEQVYSSVNNALSSPLLATYGRELRRIAEQFEQTRMRQEIRQKASQVKFQDIHRESFYQLLQELFYGGITRERICILFFFCTDVALHAVSWAPSLVTQLLGWSLSYIRDRVCLWIHDMGGWDALLCRYVPSLMVTACAILGICAFSIYIRKNLSS